MKTAFFLSVTLILFSLAACSQENEDFEVKTKSVGGPCEGCEAIFESEVSFDQLTSTVSLPDFNEAGPGISISGTVYKADGITPAPGVVIYVYHTNRQGIYPRRGNEKGWAKRHGYIRGWIKTNEHGFYQFNTLRPARYPNRNDAEHIHITIKEPGVNEYWLSEYLFDDDPLLTEAQRKTYEYRGGNGIIKLSAPVNGIAAATRNITLGLNIPGYPK